MTWLTTPLAIALFLFLSRALDVFAATSTTVLAVSALVTDNCTVIAAPIVFGSYDPLASTDTDTAAIISVFCTVGTAFTVSLDTGTTTGGTFAQRLLENALNASNTLGYNVYRNASRTEIWGDGTAGTFTVSGTGTGLLSVVLLTAYARIPAQQDVPIGAYADTITVTVTY